MANQIPTFGEEFKETEQDLLNTWKTKSTVQKDLQSVSVPPKGKEISNDMISETIFQELALPIVFGFSALLIMAFAFRRFVLWYWRIDRAVEAMESAAESLRSIAVSMKRARAKDDVPDRNGKIWS
ncbi:hypothetical protein JW899_05205 [Candidatus Uhrbacteria bacterium]|nr:hypothetical protein [Candidatus Uhrbacteria bacterium]